MSKREWNKDLWTNLEVNFSAQKHNIIAHSIELINSIPLLICEAQELGTLCAKLQLLASLPALSTDIPSITPGYCYACPAIRKGCLSLTSLVLGILLYQSIQARRIMYMGPSLGLALAWTPTHSPRGCGQALHSELRFSICNKASF